MSDIEQPDPKEFRALLVTYRDELAAVDAEAKAASATVELDQQRVGRLSRMDAMQQQEMAKASVRRRTLALARIDAALKRIDDGEYGECLHCGEWIAPARLRVDPAATLCIQCAGKSEEA